MTFDIGEVLARAGRITWKHKVLWVFSALPALLSFLVFPIAFLPIFFLDQNTSGSQSFLDNPIYIFLFAGFSILVSILSFFLYGASSASIMLGAVRADVGHEQMSFRELFNDGKKYWWRVLGVVLVVGLGLSVVFLVFFGCMILFGALTAGIGFICMQPLFLLMYPAMMVVNGYMEEALAAVVVDELSVMDALRRSWELVRVNFWGIALVSLIVYLGIGFLSTIVMMPFILPFSFIPVFIESRQGDFDVRTMLLVMGGFGLILLPVMALVQGITITFMKVIYTLVYLRITRLSGESQPALQAASA